MAGGRIRTEPGGGNTICKLIFVGVAHILIRPFGNIGKGMCPAAGQGLVLLSKQTNQHDQRLGARRGAGEVKIGAAIRICADALKKSQGLESLSGGGFPYKIARHRVSAARLQLRHAHSITFMVDAAEKPQRSVFGHDTAVLLCGKSAGNSHGRAVFDGHPRPPPNTQGIESHILSDPDPVFLIYLRFAADAFQTRFICKHAIIYKAVFNDKSAAAYHLYGRSRGDGEVVYNQNNIFNNGAAGEYAIFDHTVFFRCLAAHSFLDHAFYRSAVENNDAVLMENAIEIAGHGSAVDVGDAASHTNTGVYDTLKRSSVDGQNTKLIALLNSIRASDDSAGTVDRQPFGVMGGQR